MKRCVNMKRDAARCIEQAFDRANRSQRAILADSDQGALYDMAMLSNYKWQVMLLMVDYIADEFRKEEVLR